jgi:hypothetical protein
MTSEEIRKLGEAIAQNAELLSLLDETEEEPLEVLDSTQSLGLLKNAGFIEQIEDTLFFPGDLMKMLRMAINSSNYEDNIIPDVADWLGSFTHRAESFVDALNSSDDDVFGIRKGLFRSVHQLISSLKSSIKDIDVRASNEFGYLKTLDAKVKESNFYLNKTTELVDKLARLDYDSFRKISTHPDVEKITLLTLHHKIEGLRDYLLSVTSKLQKLSISFEETEARTRRLRRILSALNEKRLLIDLDTIDYLSVDIVNSIASDEIGCVQAGFFPRTASDFQRSRFEDIARKLRFENTRKSNVIEVEEDAYLVVDGEADLEIDHFEKQLEVCKSEFSSTLAQQSKPLSVVEFWCMSRQLQETISVNAWLYDMDSWLHDVQDSLRENEGVLSIEPIETQLSLKSNVYVLSDLIARYSKGQTHAVE